MIDEIERLLVGRYGSDLEGIGTLFDGVVRGYFGAPNSRMYGWMVRCVRGCGVHWFAEFLVDYVIERALVGGLSVFPSGLGLEICGAVGETAGMEMRLRGNWGDELIELPWKCLDGDVVMIWSSRHGVARGPQLRGWHQELALSRFYSMLWERGERGLKR